VAICGGDLQCRFAMPILIATLDTIITQVFVAHDEPLFSQYLAIFRVLQSFLLT